jgi:hypothetical protein
MKKLISAHHNGRMTRVNFHRFRKTPKENIIKIIFPSSAAATKILLLVLGGWLEGRERSIPL